ncbi:MAG: lyase family protein, partial [Paracoccaceae bacterium]
GVLADETASLPMAARTYGQAATPTSFGAVVASWGWPLLARRGQFVALGDAVLQVSLSGAAGTLSAMGPDGPAVRAALATALGLADPGRSWHSDRSSIGHLAAFAAALAGSLGKLAEDILLMSQSGVAEVSLGGAGGASSTMPQKQNPVGPSVMVALSRHVIGLAALVQGAALHRQQRDGAAWFGEWLSLPQLCICTGRLLSLADQVLSNLTPNAAAMARTLEDGQGLIQAEAISFVLAEYIPRPEAQAIVKQMCAQATATDTALMTLVAQRYPQTDWAARIAGAALGQAPAEAHAFAASLCAE